MRRPAGKGKATIIIIVGPTAIGKTALAIKLARRVGGEIISADSMQVYKGMGMLSQAPTAEELRRAPHHFVGLLEPSREYSVAVFIKKAAPAIGAIIERGKVPIVAGGTGLYVKGLVDGLFPSPKADLKFRKKMAAFAARYGRRKLHSKLARIDPGSAKKIHPNDARRIIRALEIYRSTGKTKAELKSLTRGLKDRYRIKIFGLTAPRDEIYARINLRVERMFLDGVLKEVKRLKAAKRMSRTAKAALGFSEISGYLKGRYDLACAKDMLKMNTRRFAKRQLTWFRADRRIGWLDVSKVGMSEIVGKIAGSV
ncbi:MAG: tRNA (adenosine(37)-N6)-dimethylallyltransferase MiaA [Candidatus Omnitrophota bacterium]